MAGITARVQGFKELKDRLKKAGKEIPAGIDQAMSASTLNMKIKAQQEAPGDQGILKAGIQATKSSPLNWGLFSNAAHSAFQEFGTKSKAVIPPGLESVAAQARGFKGGDYFDFLNAILDWVKRKGIASRFSVKTHRPLKHSKDDNENLVRIAQLIANSIMRHGIKPHPFFFKQLEAEQPQLLKNITKVLDKI